MNKTAGAVSIGAIAALIPMYPCIANIHQHSFAKNTPQQALQQIAADYQCGKDYFQASQETLRPATRYELAATLDHCLVAMKSQNAIAANSQTLDILQSEFKHELDTLRGTVESLNPESSSETNKKSDSSNLSNTLEPQQNPKAKAQSLFFGYQNQADFLTSFGTNTASPDSTSYQALAQSINLNNNIGGAKPLQNSGLINISNQNNIDFLPNLAQAQNTPLQGITAPRESITVQAKVTPFQKLTLSGQLGYSQAPELNDASIHNDERVNWGASAKLSDFLGKDRVGYLSLSQTTLPQNNTVFKSTQFQPPVQAEAGYQISLTKNFSITPGVIWLIQPTRKTNTTDNVISVIRTNFKF